MKTLTIIVLFGFLCLTQAEISTERVRRQAESNGDGIVLENMRTPGGTGVRAGLTYNRDVSDHLNIGGKVTADTGFKNGQPFVRDTEVSGSATYTNGKNKFTVKVGEKPSDLEIVYRRDFKRSAEDQSYLSRVRRQIPVNNPALNTAVANSLTSKQIGVPQFSYDLAGAGNGPRDFGAAGSVGTGVKLFERGQQSLGLGLGASGSMARVDGKTYTGVPQVGAGIGYQNGRFSATLGAGQDLGKGNSRYFGGTLGYKFRRDISIDRHTIEVDDNARPLFDHHTVEVDDDALPLFHRHTVEVDDADLALH